MPKPSAPQFSPPELPKAPVQSPVPSCQNDTNLPMATRSGRILKMPSRLDLSAFPFCRWCSSMFERTMDTWVYYSIYFLLFSILLLSLCDIHFRVEMLHNLNLAFNNFWHFVTMWGCLWIELDCSRNEARLPHEKVEKCLLAIHSLLGKKKVTLKELQSLIGLLNFACSVVTPGRVFLQRLINLTIGIK